MVTAAVLSFRKAKVLVAGLYSSVPTNVVVDVFPARDKHRSAVKKSGVYSEYVRSLGCRSEEDARCRIVEFRALNTLPLAIPPVISTVPLVSDVAVLKAARRIQASD